MKEYIYPKINGIYNEYSEYGYVIIRNALSKILINDITRHIDWLMEKNPDLDPENLGYWLIPKDPFWIRFLSETSLLNIAGRIIGPNIALFAADYLCKPPFIGKGVRWHQDAVYWPLEPMNVITLRFAVTEENTENGIWSITINLEPNFSPKQVSELVSKLSCSRNLTTAASATPGFRTVFDCT